MIVERERIEEWMFYVAYSSLLIFSTLGHIPVLGGYLKLLTNVSLVAIGLLIIIRNRYLMRRDFTILLIMATYAFIIISRTSDYCVLKMVLIMAATKGMNFKKIIKVDIVMRMLLMIVLFVLCYKGIAPDVVTYYPESGMSRHSYGFQNSNHLGMLLTIVVLEFLYLKDMRIMIREGVQVCALVVLSDYVSGSRTAEIVTIIALLFSICYSMFPSVLYSNIVKNIISWSVVLFSGATWVAVILYNRGNSIAKLVDMIMSGRISLIARHISYAGISLFGGDISGAGRTLDNVYAYLWIGLGIFSFSIFCIAYMRLIEKAYSLECIPLAITLFCFSIYGLSERLWLNIDYNIMMLVFRELIYGDIIEGEEYE